MTVIYNCETFGLQFFQMTKVVRKKYAIIEVILNCKFNKRIVRITIQYIPNVLYYMK